MRAVLSKTPGVETVTVDLPTQKVCVGGTVSKDVLLERIQKTGKVRKKVVLSINLFSPPGPIDH